MISLNVYLTPKPGQQADLEHAILDVWLKAMRQQPGFLWATMNTPFPDDELRALDATCPPYSYEVVSYWQSERLRQEWVARDVHQEVWPQVVALADSVSYTLSNCSETWTQ